jgi:hypothetical protein
MCSKNSRLLTVKNLSVSLTTMAKKKSKINHFKILIMKKIFNTIQHVFMIQKKKFVANLK